MPIPVVCPSCATKLRAPDDKAGRKTKCPKCGTAIVIPAAGQEAQGAFRAQPPPPPRPVPRTPLPAQDEDDHRPARLGTSAEPLRPSRAAHSLGIAALVVSVFSFLVCWIPFLGILVSGFGLLLGCGGLVAAMVRRGSGIGYSIAGSGLSAISLLICLVWTVGLSTAFKAADDAIAKQNQTNQNAVLDGNRDKGTPQDKDKILPPSQDKEPLKPPKTEPEWADASKGAVQQGDVQVRVTAVDVDFVKGKDFGEFKSKEKLLRISLQIENKSPNRKIDYKGWGASVAFVEDGMGHLTDNFANKYKRVTFGLGTRVDGQTRSASIYPGKAITDLLVFEVPVDTIEFLRLELPAQNFEGKGKLRLQIPKSMIDNFGGPISYDVLRTEKLRTVLPRNNGKLEIDVLVADKATKEQVLSLAEHLRKQYAGQYSTISIFDSREAQQRRTDESYPEAELSKHWLATVVDERVAFGKGEERITWVAEGRAGQAKKPPATPETKPKQPDKKEPIIDPETEQAVLNSSRGRNLKMLKWQIEDFAKGFKTQPFSHINVDGYEATLTARGEGRLDPSTVQLFIGPLLICWKNIVGSNPGLDGNKSRLRVVSPSGEQVWP